MTEKNIKLINWLKKLTKKGMTMRDIVILTSSKFNMNEAAIRRYFYVYDIKPISSHKKVVNDDYFNKINSEDKAYLLGFFIADGSIYKEPQKTRNSYRFQISISEEDKNILEYYKKYICLNSTISTSHYKKGAINRKPCCTIRWTSNKMYKKVTSKYGIDRRKTYDISFKFNFNTIPKKLYRHFIRGFFDGDGYISYINNQFTLGIYGTSLPFLKQIGTILSKKLNTISIYDSNIKKNIVLYCLRFNSKQKRKEFINRLYKYFYNNASMFLTRKKIKFESYLNTVLS